MSNRIAGLAVALATAALSIPLVTGQAQAATAHPRGSISYQSSACTDGCQQPFELYYNSNWPNNSGYFQSNVSISDYTDDQGGGYTVVYVFGSGNGGGQAVKNNAASACNFDRHHGYTVYYNSGYQGPSQHFGPDTGWGGVCANLNSSLYNQNASQWQTAS